MPAVVTLQELTVFFETLRARFGGKSTVEEGSDGSFWISDPEGNVTVITYGPVIPLPRV